MTASPLPHWRAFVPGRTRIHTKERLRASVGALFGIFLTGWLSVVTLGPDAVTTLIAPMGASAVLLFAVPASPLAQPWSMFGGNLVSALIGVACARWIPSTMPAAAAAISLSIFAMFALRCLHPPSGAVALTAVLGGPVVHAAGFGFALVPVALNSLLLIAVALLFNNATKRRYPHTQQLTAPVGFEPLGFKLEDLRKALEEHEDVLDVSDDDLAELFRRTEVLALQRRGVQQ